MGIHEDGNLQVDIHTRTIGPYLIVKQSSRLDAFRMFDGTKALVLCALHITCLENRTISTVPATGCVYIHMQSLYISKEKPVQTPYTFDRISICGIILLTQASELRFHCIFLSYFDTLRQGHILESDTSLT